MREQRAVNSIAFTVLVVGLILVLFRCADGPVTLPDREFVEVTTTAPPAEPVPPPPAPPVNECDVVGVNQAGVRWSVAGSVLSLFVPVSPAFGEPYVNVWMPETNHQLLRRCPANSWCDVRLPGRGPWSIRLAVETKDPTGKLFQCDRLRFDVPPSPPPSTTTTSIKPCGPPPSCEAYVDRKMADRADGVWIRVHYACTNWSGDVVLYSDEGKARKRRRCEAECGEESVLSFGFDHKWPSLAPLEYTAVCEEDEQ